MLTLYKSALFVYWGLITLLGLIPSSKSMDLFLYSDKIMHFLSFLILIFLFDKSFKNSLSLATLGALFSYGVIVEIAQSFTATRSAELSDLVANALGLLVYYLLAPKLSSRSKIS